MPVSCAEVSACLWCVWCMCPCGGGSESDRGGEGLQIKVVARFRLIVRVTE